MVRVRRAMISRSADPLWRGLVAWYPYWERSGLVAHDIASRVNHVTLTNGPTWDSMPQGTALKFDGTNDYCLQSNFRPSFDHSAANPAKQFSITAWAQPNSTSTGGSLDALVSLPEGTGLSGLLIWQQDALWKGTIVTEGTPAGSTGNIGTVTTTPTHLALTYDGATLMGYLNGDEAFSLAVTLGAGIRHNTGDLLIGEHDTGGTFAWAGKARDVRIYNRALSVGELRKIMTDPWAPFRSRMFPIAAGGTAQAIQAAIVRRRMTYLRM